MNGGDGIGRLIRLLSPSGYGVRDRVFALLAAYFDKSGGHLKGVTSVAGYVASLDEWESVEKAWRRGVSYWNKLD
jgi:hypothetical protein